MDPDTVDVESRPQCLPSQVELVREPDSRHPQHRMHICYRPSPILSLPVELLIQVFSYLAQEWFKFVAHDSPRRPIHPYQWIVVTHVCRHWREVALTAPTLWNTIYLAQSLTCIKAILARSGKTLLNVVRSIHDRPPDLAVLYLVMQELPRMAFLSVPTRADLILQRHDPHLEAPNLRELNIFKSNNSLTSNLKYAEYFSELELPSLETLKVSSPTFRLTSKLFRPTLKQLTFCTLDLPTLDPSIVLDALQSLSLLEMLAVDFSRTASGRRGVAVSRVVELANLRKLRITARRRLAPCTSLLRNIQCPAHAKIHLIVNMRDEDQPGITAFLSSVYAKLSRHENRSQAPAIRSVAFHARTGNSSTLLLRGWTELHSVEALGTTVSKHFLDESFIEIDATIDMDSDWPFNPLSIFRAIPTQNIESLSLFPVTPRLDIDGSEWRELFKQMTKVRAVGLEEHLLEYINKPDTIINRCRTVSPETYLPRVSELHLYGGRTRRKLDDTLGSTRGRLFLSRLRSTEPPKIGFETRLSAIVNQRNHTSPRLDTLVLHHCHGIFRNEALHRVKNFTVDRSQRDVVTLDVEDRASSDSDSEVGTWPARFDVYGDIDLIASYLSP